MCDQGEMGAVFDFFMRGWSAQTGCPPVSQSASLPLNAAPMFVPKHIPADRLFGLVSNFLIPIERMRAAPRRHPSSLSTRDQAHA
jgi:hypothetical protein